MRRKSAIMGMAVAVIATVVVVSMWRGGERQGRDALGIATAFLDSYYVSINLENAVEFTEGRARNVVLQQIDEIKKIPPTDRNPSEVKYRFIDERSLGDQKKSFLFELSITPQGGETFWRLVFLHLHQTNSVWRIQSFQEHNPA